MSRRFTAADFLLLLIVMAAAAGARGWYLSVCAEGGQQDGPLRVQDKAPALAGLPADTEMNGHKPPAELDALVENVKEHNWFGSLAPLSDTEEQTAHVAPGYYWLLALLDKAPARLGPPERAMRWIQCGLGTLTAAFYFLFALRAFGSRAAALLAGLFSAVHPFWIINTAEINDGVLSSFLLAACLCLGARGAQAGAPLASLLYGAGLAGLSLVRAALLPFAIVGVLWFLLRCRSSPRGWLCAVLAFLGLATGLAPWTFRNYKAYHDIVPIADSAYLHLWIGNNARATGGPQSEQVVLETAAEARGEDKQKTREELARLPQKERYDQLGRLVWQQVRSDPAGTFKHRLEAWLCFVFGEAWFKERVLWQANDGNAVAVPNWFEGSYPAALYGALLGLLTLGLLGWRWSYGWRADSMPASLAMIWVPLPYVLSHGEYLNGPRLPLDGVLLTYAAFALVCLVLPGRRSLFRGPDNTGA
jgi:4-amino-4-deoxy-L-arabinose transferase-like glycosyltransferase